MRLETAHEERQSFARICARVGDALRRRPALRGLWDLVRRHVDSDDERVPSRRRVARALGVSRHQLAGMTALLGRWVTEASIG